MRLVCGEEVFDVALRDEGDACEVEVGGQSFRLATRAVAPGVFEVRSGDRMTILHLLGEGGIVHAFWEGTAYRLSVEAEGRSAAHQAPSALDAPMPGRVTAVRVAVGQAVRRGEELLVIEAMKMENALRAPRDGIVHAVHVAVGDMVAPGRALLELDP